MDKNSLKRTLEVIHCDGECEDLWFLKLLTCARFEVNGGEDFCSLHLFYCIQIMDGLISASPSHNRVDWKWGKRKIASHYQFKCVLLTKG